MSLSVFQFIAFLQFHWALKCEQCENSTNTTSGGLQLRHKFGSPLQVNFRVHLFAKSLCRCPCTRVMGEKDYELTYKILILGDSGVGKTCLIFRFIEDIFSDSYISTIGEPWLNFVLYMLFIKTSNISLTQQTLKSTRKCLNTLLAIAPKCQLKERGGQGP